VTFVFNCTINVIILTYLLAYNEVTKSSDTDNVYIIFINKPNNFLPFPRKNYTLFMNYFSQPFSALTVLVG